MTFGLIRFRDPCRALAYKLQFALGLLYTTTLWLLKASLLALYLRLTVRCSPFRMGAFRHWVLTAVLERVVWAVSQPRLRGLRILGCELGGHHPDDFPRLSAIP
jgi:hypothetical protein